MVDDEDDRADRRRAATLEQAAEGAREGRQPRRRRGQRHRRPLQARRRPASIEDTAVAAPERRGRDRPRGHALGARGSGAASGEPDGRAGARGRRGRRRLGAGRSTRPSRSAGRPSPASLGAGAGASSGRSWGSPSSWPSSPRAFWALSRAQLHRRRRGRQRRRLPGRAWELGGGIDLFRARYVEPPARRPAQRRPSGSRSSTTLSSPTTRPATRLRSLRGGGRALSLRNRELVNLLLVGLLTATGFAAVYIARQDVVSTASLSYAAFFLALYVAAHLVVRAPLPHADPYLLPLAGVLTGARADDDLPDRPRSRLPARALGRRRPRRLRGARCSSSRLQDARPVKYILGLAAIGLLALPAIPGLGRTINGASLWVGVGPVAFQPGELAKVLLVVFLAGYLRDNREVLSMGSGRFGLPSPKHFGPLLIIWGGAMLVLFQTNDLGGGLLYFSIFLAMLYVATARWPYVAVGISLFALGRLRPLPRDAARAGPGRHLAGLRWRFGRLPRLRRRATSSPSRSTRSRAAASSGQGLGRGRAHLPRGAHATSPTSRPTSSSPRSRRSSGSPARRRCPPLPRRSSTEAFASRCMADDGFSKLLAVGLTSTLAIQAFIIVGGVTGLIPLTGITLPFVSYGGSSIVANFLIVGLLLMVSNRVNAGARVNPQIRRLFFVLVDPLRGASSACRPGGSGRRPDLEARRGNPDRARQAADDRARADLRRRRQDRLRPEPHGEEEEPRQDLVPARLSHSASSSPTRSATRRIERSRTGLEKSLNDFLTGSNANLDTVLDNTLDKLKGLTQKGNDVVTTIDARAQRVAMDAARRATAAPPSRSSRRPAACSCSPRRPPTTRTSSRTTSTRSLRTKAACGSASPLLDRAHAGPASSPVRPSRSSPPRRRSTRAGSRPRAAFDDPGYCIEYGKRVSNYSDQSGPEVFGNVYFAEALEHSINAVFCNIGKELGPNLVLDYAKRFGFYEEPPLELALRRGDAERPLPQKQALPAQGPEPGRPRPARLRSGAAARDPAPDGARRRRHRKRRRSSCSRPWSTGSWRPTGK